MGEGMQCSQKQVYTQGKVLRKGMQAEGTRREK